ncbi:Cytochrome P450 [Canna indica]|uniref:Cytochrome P450 n=1 Tax=Canna indica TaxID=4628 RepID=A0AAQ3KJJ7_9LILI|nr:Cytochrome P450 [Canna indica]
MKPSAALPSVTLQAIVLLTSTTSHLILPTDHRVTFGKHDTKNKDGFIPSYVQEISKRIGTFNVIDFIPLLSWLYPQGINKRLTVAQRILDRFNNKIINKHMVNGREVDPTAKAKMVTEMLLEDSHNIKHDGGGDDELK